MLSSTLIFLIFKWVGLRQLNTFYVIVLNYASACLFGYLFMSGGLPNWHTLFSAPWFLGALALGLTFILIFYLTALTTQQNGAGIAVIATKMSLIIPVVLAYFLYNDHFTALKITGVAMALVGVYMAVKKKKSNDSPSLLLPFVVFLASGLIDTSIKYLQHNHLNGNDEIYFVPTLFGIAFVAGSIVLLLRPKKIKPIASRLWIPAGITLGIVNFFSIHFLVLALRHNGLESSVVFSINNIGIVLLTTLMGVLLFSERLSLKNKTGVVLCAVAILVIALSR
jgi:drug/metabolite transporter (DMT)-like permease